MKAYRKAFFILARRRKTVVRRIGLPYLLSATSAALLAVGGVSTTYKCFAPIVALLFQHVPATTALSAIGIDLWGIICSVIGSFFAPFLLDLRTHCDPSNATFGTLVRVARADASFYRQTLVASHA